jgi:hypothetical protein
MRTAIVLSLLVLVSEARAYDPEKDPYLHFKQVTNEAVSKGDCVKSLATGKIYVPVNGTWGRCLPGMGGAFETTDEAKREFFAQDHKKGRFEIIKCEECK